jgi:rubrerythrin
MTAQRVKIADNRTQSSAVAVHEAMQLLAKPPSIQQWVCEVCGMVHTGAAPGACDGCGVSSSLVQHHEVCREMNSRC